MRYFNADGASRGVLRQRRALPGAPRARSGARHGRGGALSHRRRRPDRAPHRRWTRHRAAFRARGVAGAVGAARSRGARVSRALRGRRACRTSWSTWSASSGCRFRSGAPRCGITRHSRRPGPTWTSSRASGPRRIAMRTYERGVEAETLACGSGAIASARCAVADGATSPVAVLTAGGDELRVAIAERGRRRMGRASSRAAPRSRSRETWQRARARDVVGKGG